MYKQPIPRPIFKVDRSALKYASVENSLVYKLCHMDPFPPYKPPRYIPIGQIEDLVFGLRRHGASEEEIEEARRKNYYVPVYKTVKKTKKKKIVPDGDLDKVFSQFSSKPVVKKKVLKAVVKKI